MEGRIKRGIQKQCKHFLFFHHQFSEDGRFGLLRLIVVVFNFCCASDYTMANHMSLLRINSIRG